MPGVRGTEKELVEQKELPAAGFRHGTASSYNNHCCRCDKCREANTRRIEHYRKRRSFLDSSEMPHGTDNCYTNYCCRCEDCKLAHSKANKASKRKRTLLARKNK